MFKSYEMDYNINRKPINYAYWSFNNFKVREVIVNDKNTGEFHLNINNKAGILDNEDMSIFTAELSNPKIGLIDPDNLLKLEYSYYIIVGNEMIKSNISESFHNIDEKISNKKGDKLNES